MRTDQMRESQNVEDRRGMGPSRGGGPRLMVGGAGGLILLVIFVLLGGNPMQLLQSGSGPPTTGGSGGSPTYAPTTTTGSPTAAADEEAARVVVSKTLGDTEDVWSDLFQQMGTRYAPPSLVLFSGATDSGCGFAEATTGPFYCPLDSKVYIDLNFYTDLLDRRLGAQGDFAQAYVVAHEVGHHVQHLLGVTEKVHAMRGRLSTAEYNDLSVRLELQADFYAGVWAHYANQKRQILEPGDIEEALSAAAAVGDDRLQRMSKGRVVPDSFTHGTSEQRVRWFKKGFETGDLAQGNTFAGGKP